MPVAERLQVGEVVMYIWIDFQRGLHWIAERDRQQQKFTESRLREFAQSGMIFQMCRY